jgi:hypothetical protein
MKTLFQKELRENLKIAVPAWLLLIGLVVLWARDGGNGLVDRDCLMGAGILLALLGAALGWFQIQNEKPRDLWAFLVHRPISRTEIFLAKMAAGLVLYTLAASLPLFGYILWVRMPGHVAAPFEWAMVMPFAAMFLLGIIWYFAAMLSSLRQARWYGSRCLGLVVALVIHVVVASLLGLMWSWHFHVVFLIMVAIFALAVWGGFQSDGAYAGQPFAGKLALNFLFTLGSTVVVFVGLVILHVLIPRDQSWSQYEVTNDGTIYRVTTRGPLPPAITDLAGTPLKDPKTGSKMEYQEFEQMVRHGQHINVDIGPRSKLTGDLNGPREHFFSRWRELDGVVWHWDRHGQLVGYNTLTKRFVGTLAPDQPTTSRAAPDAGFLHPQLPDGRVLAPRTLATRRALYQVDVRNHATRVIFTAADDDEIGGAKDVSAQATVVVTREAIQMLAAEGKPVWKVPFEPGYVGSKQIDVFLLDPPGQYALWIHPPRLLSARLGGKIRRQMLWISGEQVVKREELPRLDGPTLAGDRFDKVLSFSVPPEFPFIKPLLFRLALEHVPVQWNLVRIGLAGSVLSAVAGWLLGRRYSFTLRARVGWAVFHLLSGFPGFLAFLSVQEWLAREPCPSCKRPRVVDRELCEHCGAAFAPAEKEGTELFAPLEADIPA